MRKNSPEEKKAMKINDMALAWGKSQDAPAPIVYEVKAPELPPMVEAARKKLKSSGLAMDECPADVYSWLTSNLAGVGITGFAGYPRLAQLAQYSEYRAPVETTATEMTREWIKIVTKGDGDLQDKVEAIEAALKDFKVQKALCQLVEHDGFFGRGQIYVDLGVAREKRTEPMVIDKATIKKGSLKGFVNIEPMWTYPTAYNSIDPTQKDFYVPSRWAVMDVETHASRLLTLVARPVPDMLKPAYNFGGMSIVQLIEPYVKRWLEGSDSIPALMKSFSLSGVKTDMAQVLQGGEGDNIVKRAQLFNLYRDNRNLMLLDKDMEEFFQFNTPLSGLDHLWAMLQEHMAAPTHVPLVILTGITPSGLNASSDGEIKVWYDYVAAQQPKQLGPILDKILDITQLHLFGEIDPNISYEWNPLEQMDDQQLADIRSKDAQTDTAYINAGVIDALEARTRLAASPISGFSGIDVDNVPEVPEVEEPDDNGGNFAQDAAIDVPLPPGVTVQQFVAGFLEEQEHFDSVNGNENAIAAIVLDHLNKDPYYYAKMEAFGMDVEFREEEHPRDNSGKFTEGSGAGAMPPKKVDYYKELTGKIDSGASRSEIKEYAEQLYRESPSDLYRINGELDTLGLPMIDEDPELAAPQDKEDPKKRSHKKGSAATVDKSVPEKFSWVNKEQVEAASQILDAIASVGSKKIGLRVIPHGHEEDAVEGAMLRPSMKWVDGDITTKALSGTSAVKIGSSNMEGVLTSLHALGVLGDSSDGFYSGAKIVLVKGSSSKKGEDPGEVIIKDAVVINGWDAPPQEQYGPPVIRPHS